MNAIPAIQVAIVGAGPSGFYAAKALLRSGLPGPRWVQIKHDGYRFICRREGNRVRA